MSLLDTASLVITPNGTKAGTLYSVVPSSGAGDMTVTRATTATRVNSAGLIESVASNVPRLDYSNGTCPSILVEPQRTNLTKWSEQFDNADWSLGNITIVTNAINSPMGTLTADKIVENTANSGHYVETVIPTTGGSIYTATVFFKKAERTFAYLGCYTNESKRVHVNLTTGAVTNTVGTIVSYNVETFANDWFRVSLTFTATTGVYTFFGASDNGTNFSYLGDGTSGIYLWGAQLELGSYATSYIPTTSASVTRNADVISKTGISSLIGQTEGTLFVDFYHDGLANFNLSSISNGVYDDAVYFEMYLGNMYAVIWDSGSQQFAYNGGSLSVGRHKMAIGYKANDTVFYIDGVLKYTDTSVTIPTTARVDVGALANATIEKTQNNLTALWKTRLTNTQLAQLTTI